MKETRDIIRSQDQWAAAGIMTALATVVHVEGSSYRRAGARMLIAQDGRLTGAISGGCLEGDALRKALHVIRKQRPMLVTYDTMDEDDATIGIGLGCNGIIQVLIEPVDPGDATSPVALLKEVDARRQPGVVATIFSLRDRLQQLGTRMFLGEDGRTAGTCPLPELEATWRADAGKALSEGRSVWVPYRTEAGEVTVFYQYHAPAVRLVVVGAGNDVIPLVDMASLLGWETTVVDGRSNYARQERFADACQVLVAKPEEVLGQVPVDDRTVFALMTHNYNYDKAMLRVLADRGVRYIAMLGPHKKINRMLEEYTAEGHPLTPEQLACVFSPAGLDIGAENAEEIALSIAAEIQAFLTRREGIFLRSRMSPIHG